MKNQSGFGLSEVLISVFLASFIMILLTQLYLSNKKQYIKTQKKLEVNFDLEWVSDLLSDSIRRAGFTPCMGINQLRAVDRRHEEKNIIAIQMQHDPQQLIQIKRMSEQFSTVLSSRNSTQLLVADGYLFKESRPVLIADCAHAEIHQILKVDKVGKNALLTLAKPLMFAYPVPPYIGEWLEEQWFIKKNDQHIDALHYKLFQTEELTPLVHSLHLHQQSIHGKQLVEITMELESDRQQKLIAAVRGS